jgi:RNA polymerase sigma-70 factor (ECF subfamily)
VARERSEPADRPERPGETPTDAVTDAALATLAGAGDTAAFRTLVARHLPAMLAVGRRMLRDDAEAEDVAQEAMLRLWRTVGRLEVGAQGLRPWLRRVVANLAIDRVRARRHVDVVEEAPERPQRADQVSRLEDIDRTRRIDAALQALPERQRVALVLFHYEGASQAEIAAAMDISEEAVESLLARARRALRTSLAADWRDLLDETEPLP